MVILRVGSGRNLEVSAAARCRQQHDERQGRGNLKTTPRAVLGVRKFASPFALLCVFASSWLKLTKQNITKAQRRKETKKLRAKCPNSALDVGSAVLMNLPGEIFLLRHRFVLDWALHSDKPRYKERPSVGARSAGSSCAPPLLADRGPPRRKISRRILPVMFPELVPPTNGAAPLPRLMLLVD